MNFGHTSFSPPQKDYYHIWIAAAKDQTFFQNNLDKAYILLLFQEILSPRANIGTSDVPEHLHLLAYSLNDFGMNLLVESSGGVRLVEDFGQQLLTRYADYIHAQQSWEALPFDTVFTYDALSDEHEALSISREIHLLHHDWRNDRYSSIGFYLDDRRGDWFSGWQLADLYDNDPVWYQNFLMDDSDQVDIHALEYIQT